MAAGTKMLFVVYSGDMSRGIGCNMAIYALGQAGFTGTDALLDGLIAFVQQHMHMLASHFVGRCYAGSASRCWYDIALGIPVGTRVVTCQRMAKPDH